MRSHVGCICFYLYAPTATCFVRSGTQELQILLLCHIMPQSAADLRQGDCGGMHASA